MEKEYLESVKQQFAYYRSVGDKTFAQLSDADLFWQSDPEGNSIAILVNHLWGNMLSRWTNFLSEDGEKEWRNRDREFESVIRSREELDQKWAEGWDCLFQALNSVNPQNFHTEIYIRNQAHSIMEAINRQLAHYAYHIGQIVFLARMIKGADWTSLTIPKGKSQAFNQQKFAQGKHKGHFSDDVK